MKEKYDMIYSMVVDFFSLPFYCFHQFSAGIPMFSRIHYLRSYADNLT